MPGLDATGWTNKTSSEIREEMADAIKAELGAEINTQADSILGVILGIYADRIGELWELGESLWAAMDPEQANDAQLDALAALTGVSRADATPTTATAALELEPGTTVAAAKEASVQNVEASKFGLDAAVSNAGTARKWVAGSWTATEPGSSTVANKGSLTVIDTPVAGWLAVSNDDLPAVKWSGNSQPFTLADGQTLVVAVDGGGNQTATFNTADFADIANATAAEVAAVIETDITGVTATPDAGRVKIASDTEGASSQLDIDVSSTATGLGFETGAINGFDGVDSTVGADEETNAELRGRRFDELERQGSSTTETIRAQLLAISGVEDARVYENNTDTAAGGLEPHSSRSVVAAPVALADSVAQVIFDNKPAGGETNGAQSQGIVDSQGLTKTIRWDWATEVPIYVNVDVDVIAADYAGDQAVKDAISAYVNGLRIDGDVIAAKVKAAVSGVAGVYDVTDLDVGDAPSPVTEANVPIDEDEIATIIDGNINVVATPVVPT